MPQLYKIKEPLIDWQKGPSGEFSTYYGYPPLGPRYEIFCAEKNHWNVISLPSHFVTLEKAKQAVENDFRAQLLKALVKAQ